MSPKYRQTKLTDWPLGLDYPVAVLKLEPEELQRRCGLSFEESYDDLDRFLGALIRVDDGSVFALVRHLGAPKKGTEIWTSSDSRHPRRDLHAALQALRLPADSVTWTAPGLKDTDRPEKTSSEVG